LIDSPEGKGESPLAAERLVGQVDCTHLTDEGSTTTLLRAAAVNVITPLTFQSAGACLVSFSEGPSQYENGKQNRHVDQKGNDSLTIQILHSSIPEKNVGQGRKCDSDYDHWPPPGLAQEDSNPANYETQCHQY